MFPQALWMTSTSSLSVIVLPEQDAEDSARVWKKLKRHMKCMKFINEDALLGWPFSWKLSRHHTIWRLLPTEVRYLRQYMTTIRYIWPLSGDRKHVSAFHVISFTDFPCYPKVWINLKVQETIEGLDCRTKASVGRVPEEGEVAFGNE
jgi:hypothetical protein